MLTGWQDFENPKMIGAFSKSVAAQLFCPKLLSLEFGIASFMSRSILRELVS